MQNGRGIDQVEDDEVEGVDEDETAHQTKQVVHHHKHEIK
jgi:hypothetical protein